jgi:7-cyano-7-deazaguanine synthase in queuosine biosynthesis
MRKIIVLHSGYGCESGCCGHVVKLSDNDENVSEEFAFEHADKDDDIEFAKNLVEQTYGKDHVLDLDWESSIIRANDSC